ncbi:MAG: IS66 family insertion sequence element accessory protein TnpB [Pseudohongiella sp.]|nr:IS66 family insertion sequence element accessory protein TnpB [Pseudohongiella sp.]
MSNRYLRPAREMPQIYLYRVPIDFRKQVNGLALLVEQELGHNPFSGALYAFTNRQHNRIKCLMWEDNGFVLYYKVLAEERFKWPAPSQALLSLSGEQINWLLDGYDITLLQGHKTLQYESVG